ncbi:Abscisic acid G-protein coupled receptor-domain-containing protein [Corynascus novoguineensis]|uniref:Abscisic acid G-protein coupled receptor-domain-containing protein n=1 Tax=Corynascus novoguineensis TaxID=1126955 RepID=A0AAN7D1A9_9PEZI|nr:Abscisic acid G-protein coupled receptor-domain-containing protein [Corynascus novoguineensis]
MTRSFINHDIQEGASCGPDSCSPTTIKSFLSTTLALAPVLLTFAFASSLALTRLFPALAHLQQQQQQQQQHHQRPTSLTSSKHSLDGGGGISIDDGQDHFLPASAPPSLRQAHAEQAARSPRRRLAAAAFAVTIGLSAVLAELILAEILEFDGVVLGARARATALRITVPSLVVLLVGVVPLLGAQSVLASRGWRFGRDAKGRLVSRAAWAALACVVAAWLVAFWLVGRAVPGLRVGIRAVGDGGDGDLWRHAGLASAQGVGQGAQFDSTAISIGSASVGRSEGGGSLGLRGLGESGKGGLSRACLERIGVIGISLMALLSGFASVSSPWHTFVDNRMYRKRPVTDSDIARKQAGLDATSELLLTKRHRLRSLQRKAQVVAEGVGEGTPHGVATGSGGGLMGKVIGSLKTMAGSGEAAEIKALQVEISGLEKMESNLAASLATLKSRQAAHSRDGTALGRLLAVPQYVFASYCIYRILATTLTTFRRIYYPSASFSSSDPINRFLGLLAKHWDPKLDQIAWARQISFLLSGVILAASANSVLQTFRIFAKWAPGLLYQAQANLALLVGQVAATYVISAALLMRSNLPKEVGRTVGDALESALEPEFVDRWFEGWFLLASAGTAAGIWVGRKVSGGFGDEWDEFAGEEMGQKRS